MDDLYLKRKERLLFFKNMRKKIFDNKKEDIKNNYTKTCSTCDRVLTKEELINNLYVCPTCNRNFNLSAKDRIQMLIDVGTFKEINGRLKAHNPIKFPGYEEKIKSAIESSKINEAIITGECMIENNRCIIGVMDNNFLMGSMGEVVGEKITRAIEAAIKKKLPFIIVCTSGGARMQEGIISLMQMCKTSAALSYYNKKNLLYISVLTNPTTGGVTASFAMLGDIILAEPDALIGFAGPRVIEQTIKQKLPEGFQRSEFLLESGFIDMIVERKDLRSVLGKLLYMHQGV